MKCDHCPFAPMQSEAGDYGECLVPEDEQVEYKDGSYGCRKTYKQLKKLDDAYSEYLGNMGEDMGIESDFKMKNWDMRKALELMMHMIGMWPEGVKHAYKRHGKLFYRPYRNYWNGDNEYLEYFCGAIGIVRKVEKILPGEPTVYQLTDHGREFLGRRLDVKIYKEEC